MLRNRAARRIPSAALALAVAATLALNPATAAAQTARVTVEQAMREALTRNREIRSAQLQLAAAERQVDEAWSSVFPTIELNASYTRNISPAVSFLPARIVDPNAGEDEFVALKFGADNSWSSNIRFEQPLFQAKAFLGVGASGRFRALKEEEVRGVAMTVVTRVRLAYYNVLLAEEQQRLLQKSVERVRAALSDAQAMNRAGILSEYDVLRLEVELGNLEPNLRRAENSVLQRRRDLSIEVGGDGGINTATVGTLSALDLDDPARNTPEDASLLLAGIAPADVTNRELLVESALANRSDTRQLDLIRSLRHTEMKVEQTEYLPRVSLFGNYIINAQQNGRADFFGSGGQQRAYSRLAGVQVTVPIFAGLRENARIGQRREVLREAETTLELARARAEVQIDALIAEVQESQARVSAQKRSVAQAQRGFEIASAQFREGIGSQLERTDAEVALRQSEFNYAQAVFDYLAARARLDEAAGRVPLVTGEVR